LSVNRSQVMTANCPQQSQSNPLGMIAGHYRVDTEYENLD